jgi:hypothetical protein
MSSIKGETLYFFDQPKLFKTTFKRKKKIVDQQTLDNINKKLNSKFPNGDLLVSKNDKATNLTSRVAELTLLNTVKSNDTNPDSLTDQNPSSLSTNETTLANTYTDARLQAVKFLTEDLIKELEELLVQYSEYEVVPNLPSKIIYELHADWSDLTDKCNYDRFPLWQTKKGKDGGKKDKKEREEQRKEELDTILNSNGSQDSTNASKHRSQSRKSISSLSNGGNNNNQNSHVNINQSKLNRQHSKLGLIFEDQKFATPAPSQTNNSKHSATTNPTKITSRFASYNNANNNNNQNGCLVNYQLSSRLYREKGWTVLGIESENQLIDSEHKIMVLLKNSLQSM